MLKQLIRFSTGGFQGYGLLGEKGKIQEVNGDPFGEIILTDRQYDQGQVRLLPPCQPSKIVAVGLNYKDHARELKLPEPAEPLIFLKPPSAIIAHEEAIIYPSMSRQVEYEGELGIIIKKQAKGITQKEADEYVLGYTCFNDITARDLQKKDGQWTRAKSFDTFAAVGPCLTIGLAPENLAIKTYLNGQLRQSSHTSQLIFPPSFLVSFISQIMTLFPGDLIATGTPAGVGAMHPGDVVEIEIEGIGTLCNRVQDEKCNRVHVQDEE